MRVLVVCTGNVCRSPVIEAALRSRLPGLELTSAGTRAGLDRPVHPLTRAAMLEHGLPEPAHRSKPLTSVLLQGVDLVVTAERAHRAPVLSWRPDLLRRTFTFLELVELAGAVRPALAVGEEVAAMHAVVLGRGRHHPAPDADLPDPVQAGPPEHARMVSSVVTGVDRLLGSLVRMPDGPV